MTKPRPHFWYCFTCNEKVMSWKGIPSQIHHTSPTCDVQEAMAMRVPKKKDTI